MPKISVVKQTAKMALKNKWPSAICVFVVAAAVFAVRTMLASLLNMIFAFALSSPAGNWVLFGISTFLTVLDIFAFGPAYLGALRWFWQVSVGTYEPVFTVFYYYNDPSEYKKAIGVAFGVAWRGALYSIISFLPLGGVTALMMMMTASIQEFSPLLQTGMIYIWLLTAILGVLLVVTLFTKYFPLAGVLFSDESLTARRAFKVAKMISKGRRAGFMYLLLTLFGFIMMCVVAIPMLWVVPYLLTSYSVYSRYSITDFNLENSGGPENGILEK